MILPLFSGYYCLVLVLASICSAVNDVRVDYFKNTNSEGLRIVGGIKATRYQFPYQVSIQFKGRHICGGALINESRVITAAHCKMGMRGKYHIVAGILKLNEHHEDNQKIRVNRFITHPRFPTASGTVETNDIAFLDLSKPVKLTHAVQLINLPTLKQCESLEAVIITGWGYIDSQQDRPSNALRWAKLPRVSNKQCATNLRSIRGTSRPLDKTMICTVAEVGQNKSACNGDSGGPLVRDNVIVGVVSWGLTPCGVIEGAPTVGISVCIHNHFILRSSATRIFLNYIKSGFILSVFVIFVYLRKLQC